MARSVMKASPVRRDLVRKADPKDGGFIAAYDQHGRLIGIVDPEKITPVANPGGTTDKPAPTTKTANERAGMPKPASSGDAAAQSGQEPAMGIREATPQQPAGVPVSVDDDIAKQRRAAEVRKGLYSGGTAAEQAGLAEYLNRAAIKGLGIIHGHGAA